MNALLFLCLRLTTWHRNRNPRCFALRTRFRLPTPAASGYPVLVDVGGFNIGVRVRNGSCLASDERVSEVSEI